MGILGSAFGRALAGGGAAAAQLTNKYIDEALVQERAKALADIQFASSVRTEEYQQSAPVQERRTANATQQSLAQAAAARRAKTEGMGDTDYQAALDAESDAETGRKVRSANQVLEGTTDAEVKRNTAIGEAKTAEDIKRATAMLPLEVKKAYAVADAAGRASARNREAPGADLSAKLRIVQETLGRPLTEPEKLGLLGLAGKAPEAGTVQEETDYGPDGAPISRKVTEKRPLMPGARGNEAADPIKAAMDAARAAKDGKPGDPAKPGPTMPTRKDPISGQMLTEREWDRKFGRGDFKKDNGDGLPSMRPF